MLCAAGLRPLVPRETGCFGTGVHRARCSHLTRARFPASIVYCVSGAEYWGPMGLLAALLIASTGALGWSLWRVTMRQNASLATCSAATFLALVSAFFVLFRQDASGALTLLLWPIGFGMAVEQAVLLGFWVLCLAPPTLLLASLAVALLRRAWAPLILAGGAALALAGPALVQSQLLAREMLRGAEAEELRVIRRQPLIRSIRQSGSGYLDPHGLACDGDGWPHLWSYKTRAWHPLPLDTRYGGDTPDAVRRTCARPASN